ncbi:MAG: SIS domain-containing protein [Sphaerobacter sp.]|nr:SIS domain-containing protein [Sphaerobacter sp.]
MTHDVAPMIARVPAGAVRAEPHPLARALAERQRGLSRALGRLAESPALAAATDRLLATLQAGRTVLVAGNGGSAAAAQHFASELVGRFKRERAPYPVLALTTDSAVLTAVANDYGYDQVFARQVAAFGRPGDLLVAISTSGESASVLRAAAVARERGLGVIAVTGARDSGLARLADLAVRVPVADTALVQEVHMILTHLLCDLIEAELAAGSGGGRP